VCWLEVFTNHVKAGRVVCNDWDTGWGRRWAMGGRRWALNGVVILREAKDPLSAFSK